MDILPTSSNSATAAAQKQAGTASKSALDEAAKAFTSPNDTVELSNRAQALIKKGGPDSAFSIVGG